ncbi:uncharacterized protein [Antennarius striatus]|uniref:uncharacterized protein isoform X2 n=1 Tax=Antennarius striatus TaxID=241820 RepID=UPI0035AE45FA
MATWSRTPEPVKTQTVSSLVLLRAQPGTPSAKDPPGVFLLTDLQFEDEEPARPGKDSKSTPQQAAQTVRMLCGLASDPQLVSQEFLQLTFRLRDLTLDQLQTLWQETSFKCRDDWQPLLEALPACGSESCVLLLTDLLRRKEVDQEQAHGYLTSMALIPHPSAAIIDSINALLEVPELQPQALLSGSSLVHQLCQRSQSSCAELPQVETFIEGLKETLKEGCEDGESAQSHKLLYALKSVGNVGLSAPVFIPLLNHFLLGRPTAVEIRLAAIHAFRRFPCSADRSVLLQLYRTSQEDPEVRIAAYQQLLRCPDRNVFEVVKKTLRKETSSQVGSYVWSHLTHVLRSEDPVKQGLAESLPDDIITRDFEAEFLKYSSYSDYTASSGFGVTNVETSLIFSPKSFLPRSATVNLTVYLHGRAHNLLELDLHVENAEPLLRKFFDHQTHDSDGASGGSWRTRRADEAHDGEKRGCSSPAGGFLERARAMLFGSRRPEGNGFRCRVGVKVFGSELSVFSCDDVSDRFGRLSLSAAALVVKLLKGQEVQLNQRAVLLTDQLVLPSLSGLPLKLGVNLTSLLSLRLKGDVDYRDASHFSLAGFIKPTAHVGLSARMGVDGVLGRAAVDWVSQLRSSTSLDGSLQLQEGRDVKITLNTPEDVMDIFSLSSRWFHLTGDHTEEMKGPKSRVQKTSCTPKTWSKMMGWQLCSNASYPSFAAGASLPLPGPAHLSLRLLKLDRGLHRYQLEAAYSLTAQSGSWLPREASIHLLLATPQSSVPRDTSLDLVLRPRRLLLRLHHPLKTIHLQGQLDRDRTATSGKLELLMDGVRYFILGLVDAQNLPSEQRTRYHLESKLAAHGPPMILSANVTRGSGGKTGFSATVRNVFRKTASLSVVLERRRDGAASQYSVEAELLLPGAIGIRMLGLMEQKASLWSSMLRLKYGVGGDARHLRQECSTSQRLRSERLPNLTYVMRGDHEFFCSNTAAVNHKIHLRHEESPRHTKSSLDVSYGKHWDEINNKRTVFLSQSFKNQSAQNHSSYRLEFHLQVPERNLNYRTQLLHSHLRQVGSESSTHLKINYNGLTPLVAGLRWKSPPRDGLGGKWEGAFNLDAPWLNVRRLLLEGFYRGRGGETEARLKLHTPTVTYIQAGGWVVMATQSVKVSTSLVSLWTPAVSLEASASGHALQVVSSCGEHNVSLDAALSAADKVLKKRRAALRVVHLNAGAPPTELHLEGVVEELRRDKKVFQKTAALQLRCDWPLQVFPQTLRLRGTFTVNLPQRLYILESRAGFHGDGEAVHTLTLGYRPRSPFVCSALTHPFSADVIPSDSEVCVGVASDQTQKDVEARLRIAGEDRLTLTGQVLFNPLRSERQEIQVKANFSHQLQLKLPSSAVLEGNVCWERGDVASFRYQAAGRLRVERTECELSARLNASAGSVELYSKLSHPFKAKIPRALEVKATAGISSEGGGGSSLVQVRADGKDRVRLDAWMRHAPQGGDQSLELRVNVSQSLLPVASDLRVGVAANVTSDSVSLRGSYSQGGGALLAQVGGSLRHAPGLQLMASGDLRRSGDHLTVLPPLLGVDVTLGQSDGLVEGQIRLRGVEVSYRAELRHHRDPPESLDGEDEEGGTKHSTVARDWLCVWVDEEHFCVNLSRRLGDWRRVEVHTGLSHTSHLLNATGVPSSSDAQVRWLQDGGRLSVLLELQAGPEHLRAEINGGRSDRGGPGWGSDFRLQHRLKSLKKRGVAGSIEARTHYQTETDGLNAGLALHVDDNRLCDVLFHVGSKNSSSTLEVSLWQQTKLLQGLVPTSFQMNCTGGATADGLDARCYGNVAGRPAETSADVSVTRSDCSSRLRSVVTVGGGQKASLHLRSTCLPHLRLEASVEHSIIAVETLGLPPHAAITLSVSTPRPAHVEGGLEVGPCYFGGNLGETRQVEEDQWLYSGNLTSYCPPLPTASLTLRGLLSVAPQRLNLTSSLRADDQQVSLDLSRSTGPQRFSGTIQNSFLGWRRRGLPQVVQVEATTPRGPKQAGGLFVKAGTCSVRTNGFMQTEDGTKWVWALESRCPPLKTRVNVSVWTDPRGVWTATLDTDLEGQTGSLRLNARPPPELSVDAELRHNLPALRDLPQHVRLRVTGRAAKQRYDAGALVQVEGCAVGAGGGVMSQGGLRGALRYHNNCTVIQEWGGPDRMLVSGALVVSPALTEAQVSMAMDDRELEAAVALKKTKDKHEASLRLNHSVPLLETLGLPNDAAVAMNSGSHDNGSVYFLLDCSTGNQTMVQEATATRTSGAVRVTAGFIHTLNPLKELGVPANSSIQAELGSLDGTALTLRLQSGGQQVGMNLQTKCFPRVKEVRGTMWNGWSWLQLRGVPRNLEGLCSVQGVWSQFQSRVRLAVDGHRLMASGLNVSEAAGRLELLVSYPPPASDGTGTRPVLDATLTSRFRGPLWSVSVDLQGPDWGVQAIGDLEGTGGSKESKVTLKHTRRGHTSPALQVEAWGRLTESQLRCSIAVNPELSSSLALILQGRRLPHSKDLMVKVVQNIPGVLAYLPSQVNVRSLMNHSGSAVAGLVEVSSGRRRLWAQGELAALPSGFRQAAELRHSFPQLKPLPRTVAVKTVYEARNWSHQVQHGAMWGNQELYLSGLYSTPPSPEMGTQTIRVQVRSIPRWTNLEAVMETSAHRRLDSVLLGWTRHGRLEEVGVLSSWSRSAEVNETRLEVKQPFLLPLGQMSLHVRSQGERRNSQQTLLWWNISAPVNISLNVSRQWQNGSSRGQACALFSTPQTAVSPVKGCVSASQEGNSYSQNAELRWDDRSVQQGVKYQRSPGGVHRLQVTLGLDKVSPTPCPSHHILTKIQTNFRDRLEHSVLLSLCPTHPSFLWEGSHRVSSGEELFHTRSLLSVAGRPDPIRFTVALRNSSSALGSNTSLLSERSKRVCAYALQSRTRSWSLEVEGSVLMGPRGSGVLVQAQLDDRQNVWLNGTLEGRCLQTAAGSALGKPAADANDANG